MAEFWKGKRRRKSQRFFPLVPPSNLPLASRAAIHFSLSSPPLPQLLFSPLFSACVNFYDSHFPSFCVFLGFLFRVHFAASHKFGAPYPTLSLPPFSSLPWESAKKPPFVFIYFLPRFRRLGKGKLWERFFFLVWVPTAKNRCLFNLGRNKSEKKRGRKHYKKWLYGKKKALTPPFFELDPKHPLSHIFLAISDAINYKIHVKKVKLKGVIVLSWNYFF